MTKLTKDMKRVISEQRLGFMATVCSDGTPNLSPKGLTFVLDDEHLLVGEVRSPQTISNLSEQPTAEISVVDPIARKGFRFKGRCEVHTKGTKFEELVSLLHSKGAKSRIKSTIIMRVERALPVTSPAYDLGRPELDVRKQWKQHFDRLNKDISSDD